MWIFLLTQMHGWILQYTFNVFKVHGRYVYHHLLFECYIIEFSSSCLPNINARHCMSPNKEIHYMVYNAQPHGRRNANVKLVKARLTQFSLRANIGKATWT